MIAEKGVTIGIHASEDEVVYIQPEDVKSVDIVQECDKVSKVIPESYGTVVIKAQENFINNLPLKTPFVVYFNGKPKMNLYVETTRNRGVGEVEVKGKDLFFVYDFLRTTKFHWIQAPEDYFFKNAYEVFDAFFQECGVPYEIDDSVKALTVNGVIEKNKPFKDVLLSLLFASGARVVAGDKFYVRALGSSAPKIIKSERIIGSVSIDRKQSEAISLTVPYVDYSSVATEFKTRLQTSTSLDNYNEWIDGDTEYGTTRYNKKTRQITVTMRDKYGGQEYGWDMMSEVLIKTENFGSTKYTFRQSKLEGVVREKNLFSAILPDADTLKPPYNQDYLVIRVYIGRVAEPQTGEYKIESDNPYATQQTANRLTTINSNNVEQVATRLYNDDIKSEEIRCSIAERKFVTEGKPYKYGELTYGTAVYGQLMPSIITYDEEVNVGDTVEVNLNKLGVFQKVVTKQSYSLNGGIIVKDTTLR